MWHEITLEMANNYQDYLPQLNRIKAMQDEMNSYYETKMTLSYISNMIKNKQSRGLKAYAYLSADLDMTLVTYRGKEERNNQFRVLTAALGKYTSLETASLIWHEKLKEIANTYGLKEAYAIMLIQNYPKGQLWFDTICDDITGKNHGLAGISSVYTEKNRLTNFKFN